MIGTSLNHCKKVGAGEPGGRFRKQLVANLKLIIVVTIISGAPT